jgi:hypothetical protein
MPITRNDPGTWVEQLLDTLLNASDAKGPVIADPRRVVHSQPMSHINQDPIPTVRSPDRSLSMEDAIRLRGQ